MRYPVKSLILAALTGAALLPTAVSASNQRSGELIEFHRRFVAPAGQQQLGAPLGGREEEENVYQGLEEQPADVQSGRSATPVPPPGQEPEPNYMRAAPGTEPAAPRAYEPGAPLSPRAQEHNVRGLPY